MTLPPTLVKVLFWVVGVMVLLLLMGLLRFHFVLGPGTDGIHFWQTLIP
jgi:hypothetical protein